MLEKKDKETWRWWWWWCPTYKKENEEEMRSIKGNKAGEKTR